MYTLIRLIIFINFLNGSIVYSSLLDINGFNETVKHIIENTNPQNIAQFLRTLTLQPHVAGTQAELDTAHFVANAWREQGLDQVHLTPYDVLLSYSDQQNPNYVRLFNSTSNEIWKSQGWTKPLHAPEEYSDQVFPDFVAYSPPGIVNASIVFANFGGLDDFAKLEELGVNVTGCIVIAKYGKYFRGNIVQTAEQKRAVGVILYSDPQLYAQEAELGVYADSVYMPGSAAAYGTIYMDDGDPLTPFYPSIESAYRIAEEEANLPKIPAIPLGYDDASIILRNMGGNVAPNEWQGGLNLTYKLGPGFEDAGLRVTMEVNTRNKRATTYNVIGVLKGEEKDRFVLLGNHRDAWVFGAVDPSSATAVMLELSRVLADYSKATGWRPRRTLVFCSWGSEEHGLLGSSEWTEQFGKQLGDRAVAYLNLDMAIEGNSTIRTKASPLLYNISKEVSKLVPNPNPNEVANGRKTVFDTWLFNNPDATKEGSPKFTSMGAGSDYKSFQHNLGIPSMEYRYTASKEMNLEPLYHTLYETFYLVNDLYDKGFHYHVSVAQLWGIIAVALADAEIIPFSIQDYASFIIEAQANLVEQYGSLILEQNITLGYFITAAFEFEKQTNLFQTSIKNLNKTNILEVREVNDQLMMVERAFIDPQGLPGRPHYNHVVFAPSSTDNYAATAFAGLSDALNGIASLPEEEQKERWRSFKHHLAACTHLLQTAAKVLTRDLWG